MSPKSKMSEHTDDTLTNENRSNREEATGTVPRRLADEEQGCMQALDVNLVSSWLSEMRPVTMA